MIISCSNCGMNCKLQGCIAETIGYKYKGAYQCPYFVPVDIGEKEFGKESYYKKVSHYGERKKISCN